MTDEELADLLREAITALNTLTRAILSLEVQEAPKKGKRGPKSRYTAIDTKEVLERHLEGEPVKALAEEYGVSQTWLYGRLHELDPQCSQKAMLARRQQRYRARMNREPGPGRGAWQESKIEDVQMAKELWLAGSTLEEMSQIYGVTRERVRQVIEEHYPGTGKEARRRRLERHDAVVTAQEAEKDAALQERVDRGEAPLCRVCGKPNRRALTNRNTPTTCSDECAEAWVVLRYYLEKGHAEQHRVSVAKSVLKRPDSTPVQIRHAERVLAGTAKKRGRLHIIPGSRVEEFARRFRPELLDDYKGREAGQEEA